jgi:hypothetical protein
MRLSLNCRQVVTNGGALYPTLSACGVYRRSGREAKSNGRTDSAAIASYTLPVPNRGARCAKLTSSVVTAAGDRYGRLDGACSALARRIHQPSYSDTDGVERDHWGGEKAHVQDVGGRCDNCRNNKNCEYGISQVPPHPASRNDPHQSEEEYENRHFEHQSETDDDGQEQLLIFSNRNRRLEALSVTD